MYYCSLCAGETGVESGNLYPGETSPVIIPGESLLCLYNEIVVTSKYHCTVLYVARGR